MVILHAITTFKSRSFTCIDYLKLFHKGGQVPPKLTDLGLR